MSELREPDPIHTEIAAVEKADELLEADPVDSGHLFFEELRRIGRALREMKPEELTDEDIDVFASSRSGDHRFDANREKKAKAEKRAEKAQDLGVLATEETLVCACSPFKFSYSWTYNSRLR